MLSESILFDQELSADDQDFQHSRFALIFPQLLSLIRQDSAAMVSPFWWKVNQRLEREFVPCPPWNFLRNETIQQMMFVGDYGYTGIEFAALKKAIPSYSLIPLLTESAIGCPATATLDGIVTSGNTVHMAHHIVRFLEETKIDPYGLKTILEFGGGYGKMCQLWKRINPDLTYIIIDTRLFACVQAMYLSCILGPRKVHVLSNKDVGIETGKINIVPLAAVGAIQGDVDLFVSTWALSESPAACLNYVASKDAWGAKHFLMAHQNASQDFPMADEIKCLVDAPGFYHKAIDFIPGNSYIFA
jgi:hypothetical protein